MDSDIKKLLNEIADGGTDALGLLYDLLSRRVYNYALSIARKRELAEDITHEVFLSVHANARRVASTSCAEAYIMVMTRHCAYDLLKRQSREVASPHGAYRTNAAPHERLLFEDAFSALPANQREAVYLHLVCGYSHNEVAEIQNAPLVTVKWRYLTALKRLKTYFSADEKEEPLDELT